MEEEEGGEISSPFWTKTSAHRRRRTSPSLFLNSGVLLFALCITLSLVLLFILPSILSLTPRIFKPKIPVIKNTWDSINVLLVSFALIFGFLSRNQNREFPDYQNDSNENRNEVNKSIYEYSSDRTAATGLRRTYSSYPDLREISAPEGSGDPWHRFYDDTSLDGYQRASKSTIYQGSYIQPVQSPVKIVNTGITCPDRMDVAGLKRAYGSYPDFREISPPEDMVDRWRFYDDTSLDAYRADVDIDSDNREGSSVEATEKIARVPVIEPHLGLVMNSLPKPVDGRSEFSVSESQRSVRTDHVNQEPNQMNARNLTEDRVIRKVDEGRTSLTVRRPTRRAAESIVKNRKSSKPVGSSEQMDQYSNRKTKRTDESEERIAFGLDTDECYKLSPLNKSDRKRAENETKHFLDSLRKKKKKPRQKSIESFETLLGSQPQVPPSPPPPPSIMQNFSSSKKGKSKKIITVPSRPSSPYTTTERVQKLRSVIAPTTACRPLLPVKIRSFVEDASNSGGESPMTGAESPLHPIPPPPPPPPFKMPSWKFVVKGDFVRIGSMSSSRSVSPDPDEVDSPTSSKSGGTPTAVDGGEAAELAMFCPSPDVNSKADMFIAKVRAGLKLQKMDSMKRRQGVGLSNLGPTTKPR